jgi:hypothetical protein
MVYIPIRENISTQGHNTVLDHLAKSPLLSFIFAQLLNILSKQHHNKLRYKDARSLVATLYGSVDYIPIRENISTHGHNTVLEH